MSEKLTNLKTDRMDIVIENHPFDRGYWKRFNGLPRPRGKEREGWDACHEELTPAGRAALEKTP